MQGKPACEKQYDPKLKMDVYTNVDQWPEYPDGIEKMYAYIKKNMISAIEADGQKKLIIEFIIGTKGQIIDEKIIDREPSAYTDLEKNIIKKVRVMPHWKPAKCNNSIVPFRYRVIANISMSLGL